MELHQLGVTRYGTQWFTRLAAEMGVTETTIRRWAKGDLPITERAANHIKLIFEQKVAE